MSFLSRLFRRKETVPGIGAVPPGLRQVKAVCVKCSKKLQAVKGGTLEGSGDQMLEYVLQKPLFCTTCQMTYCSACSHDAASRRGIGHFICPDCGGDIGFI